MRQVRYPQTFPVPILLLLFLPYLKENPKPYSSCFSEKFQIGWEFPPEVCLAFSIWKNRIFPDLPVTPKE
jgi:hypothetical protein